MRGTLIIKFIYLKRLLSSMYDIILGRDVADSEEFEGRGLAFLGRLYVTMGTTTSLSNNVYLDLARSHVVLISD